VKDSKDPGALESFLRHFGDGFYADLARARLAELKRQPVVASFGTSRTLSAAQGSEPTVQFGGQPYCRYAVTLKNLRISAPADGSGLVTNARLSLLMVEHAVLPCPHPPLGSKPHNYVGSGQVKDGKTIVLSFSPVQGNAPMANATFTGTVVDDRLVGTLAVQRTDTGGNLAWKLTSQFK
jgi:hypothetical protein